jgi:hypothetical protein
VGTTGIPGPAFSPSTHSGVGIVHSRSSKQCFSRRPIGPPGSSISPYAPPAIRSGSASGVRYIPWVGVVAERDRPAVDDERPPAHNYPRLVVHIKPQRDLARSLDPALGELVLGR